MEIDSQMLEESISNKSAEPVFRLYGWSPRCISLGRNQQAENLSCHSEGKARRIPENIDVVRRITGGRALLHDDEITYSCVFPVSYIPNGESVTESYKYISGILIDFFKTLGIELDFGGNNFVSAPFGGEVPEGGRGEVERNKSKISTKHDYCMLISTGADVCYKGQKIIGSAQCRKNGYILQHGSILYDYDKDLLENLFNERVEGITCIKQILPDLDKAELVEKLSDYILSL